MGKYKHGLHEHPLYGVWMTMKNRCSNPAVKSYHRYGGRGITVCDEWQEFMPFYEWAVSAGWEKGLSIEREDNDGPYAPDNCCWATAQEQANNRSSNRQITAFGETKSVAEWGRDARAQMPASSIYRRINRHGWEPEAAIATPSLGTGRGRASHDKE